MHQAHCHFAIVRHLSRPYFPRPSSIHLHAFFHFFLGQDLILKLMVRPTRVTKKSPKYAPKSFVLKSVSLYDI